jgi:hypothetical protein
MKTSEIIQHAQTYDACDGLAVCEQFSPNKVCWHCMLDAVSEVDQLYNTRKRIPIVTVVDILEELDVTETD